LELRHLLGSEAVQLTLIHLLAIALYLAGITWFGLRFRGRDRSLRSYFLANGDVPWWAIALSIVAAETSTLTIISIPGLAYTGDFGFLQIALGYLLGRAVICVLLLPRYFDGKLITAYQLIGTRFGVLLHRATAGLFLATRAAAEGVRIFAVSIVITVAFGTGSVLSIALLTALTLLYTFEGGFSAVIWTDVVQMLLYFAGTLLALVTLTTHVPGGWHAIHAAGAAAHKFTVFHFALSLTQTYTFWGGLIGGCFLTMASHGTDQLVVQRLLAARTLAEARLALMTSGFIVFVQFTLFLLIGAGLYVFYPAGTLAHVGTADRLFPLFIVQQMPHGISGLVIAAILASAMSNMSAALNSLSSTTMVDFYLPRHPQLDERARTRLSRMLTAAWAVVLLVLALLSRTGGHVVEIGLSIASVTWGEMLGVFLLGTLTRRASEDGTMVGMLVGLIVNLLLWQQPGPFAAGHALALPRVAFIWYVLIGAAVTSAVGYSASLLQPQRQKSAAA
jgi:SSS family solute:Na+ symporter